MLQRRRFIASLPLALLAPGAFAQTARGAPKIGVLRWDRAQLESAKRSLTGALGERGYVDGKNVTILWRYAEQKAQRADEIVREFVREQVSVIVASPTPAAHAARRGTDKIPIVLSGIADPVASGLVSNIARPGGNVTGASLNLPALAGKRVEVLRDALPGLKRIAFLGASADPATKVFVANTGRAAETLGISLHVELVAGTSEIEGAFARIAAAGAEAVVVQPIFWTFATQVGEIARRHRLPTISDFESFARDGGLLSYGPNRIATWQIVADYIDKILKGTRPGDLPIQEPTRFSLVVNLKTAKALGITVAAFVLDRADEVIR